MCLPWSISIVMTHNLAQNAFLIYTGFSASNGGHFSVYSTTFLPFFERKFDAYLRRICLFDAYLRRSGGFMCQMTLAAARTRGRRGGRRALQPGDPRVQLAYTMYVDHRWTIEELCATLGISRATCYRYVA